MKIYINDTEYRLTNDAEIREQAGATAVMDATILLEDKRIPQPFDKVEVKNGDLEAGFTGFASGVRVGTKVVGNVLSLARYNVEGTWSQWAGFTWEDLA